MKKILLFIVFFPILLFGDNTKKTEDTYEVVVLGGGIGGLTSAVYLARAKLHPLVIEGRSLGGALGQSPSVQNWPGEPDIPGNVLVEKIKKQAIENGAIIDPVEVVEVDFTKSPFKLVLRDPFHPRSQRTITAKACIVATGAVPKKLGISGEEDYWLKGIHTCAVCDGHFYKNHEVIVVGGGDSAITEAFHLAKSAKTVTLLVRGSDLKTVETTRKEQLLALPNVKVMYHTTIQKVVGKNGELSELVIKTKNQPDKVIPAKALFLAIGSTPNTKIFKQQLALDEKGHILLFKAQETNIPGVFAIGDVTDPQFRQAITAAGDGAKAALQAEEFLSLTSPRSSQNIAQTPSKSFDKTDKEKTVPDQIKIDNVGVILIRTLKEFQKTILESKEPVIVDFYADWCGPCKMLDPHMQKWSEQFASKIKFFKVNIDQLPTLAEQYNVRAVPTVLYFDKNGTLLDSRTGSEEIANLIEQLEINH